MVLIVRQCLLFVCSSVKKQPGDLEVSPPIKGSLEN